MKKQMISLMIVMFLVGYVTANVGSIGNHYDNFIDAKDKIDSERYKEKVYRDNLNLEYKYTTDKICDYNYVFDTYECLICYNLTRPIVHNGCVNLPQNSSRVEDDEAIENNIKAIISLENFEYEEVDVNVRDEGGRRF